MSLFARMSVAVLMALLVPACTPAPPPPDPTPPSPAVLRQAAMKFAAVVVSSRALPESWSMGQFQGGRGPDDADGGSAVPVAPDGYFLTADHVLAHSSGRTIQVFHAQSGRLRSAPARIVWRSGAGDLALLHIERATPHYYRWASPDHWIPEGTPVIHTGISTGFRSPPGKLMSGFAPGAFGSFKYDIPLQPGDSGGAVLNARGELIGVNSAVEYLVPIETAFFIESEANRPSIQGLESIIARDRRSRAASVHP